jgi:hypothetical protein
MMNASDAMMTDENIKGHFGSVLANSLRPKKRINSITCIIRGRSLENILESAILAYYHKQ